MLGVGVEIWLSKLKLRIVVGESLVVAHVKVPINLRPGFPFIAKIQDGRLEFKFFLHFRLIARLCYVLGLKFGCQS